MLKNGHEFLAKLTSSAGLDKCRLPSVRINKEIFKNPKYMMQFK